MSYVIEKKQVSAVVMVLQVCSGNTLWSDTSDLSCLVSLMWHHIFGFCMNNDFWRSVPCLQTLLSMIRISKLCCFHISCPFFKKNLVCLADPKLGRGKPFLCQWKPHSLKLDRKKYASYSSKKSTVKSWAWLFFTAVVLLHYLCRHLSSILSCITGE